ncbi:hypothetical protein PAECIP112173_04240 [Paenibacillus sp. JJ-100]|uniref:hypothetical protein n=1 Tax=Paenibacillus sp. JJ-100 TaxID=2974896 RepID=UPI0022FFBF17|nr:hypothetical protein [Paenibacillus sp. JJ-100]CAI6084296.1 hypothetical protein PAECIP112173_04240 [Paenibacillus sp. JJ-100]
MSTYTSIQFNGMETLFLFELINIPEAEQLRTELVESIDQAEQSSERVAQILKDLAQDRVVEINDQQVAIEPQIHRLLMACKLSSAITRLELNTTDQGRSVTYGFLSSDQLVEWVWKPEDHQSIFTPFSSMGEMFQVLGNRLEIDDSSEETTPELEQGSAYTSIGHDTLRRLFELDIQASGSGEGNRSTEATQATEATERIQVILQADQHLKQTWVQPLSRSLAALEQRGKFEVYTRGTDDRSQWIYFIGSERGNWIFLEVENEDLFTVFKVTEEELVQSLFLLTTRSMSVLPEVR